MHLFLIVITSFLSNTKIRRIYRSACRNSLFQYRGFPKTGNKSRSNLPLLYNEMADFSFYCTAFLPFNDYKQMAGNILSDISCHSILSNEFSYYLSNGKVKPSPPLSSKIAPDGLGKCLPFLLQSQSCDSSSVISPVSTFLFLPFSG